MLKPMDAEILAAVFRSLNEEGVRYVVFGGIAVIARGVTQATQDLDLFLDAAVLRLRERHGIEDL